jgi:hypothetical protein
MAIAYKTCNGGTIPDYICDPCEDTEKGRIRGAALIHKSLLSALATVVTPATTKNIETKAWWETQIEAGLIKTFPKVRGTYDGGAPITTTGFGDVKEKTIGKTHTVVINDPNHKGNATFYDAIEENATDYVPAFITGSELRAGTTTLQSAVAKDEVSDDVDSEVVWSMTLVWKQTARPYNVPIYVLGDVKNVFNCIDKTAGV